MKKNYIIIFLSVLLLAGFVSSCYDDDSTFATIDVGNVEIDTTGISTLSVYQFDTLVVEPTINVSGVSESDLSYKWRLQLIASIQDTAFAVIGTEKNLEYEMRLAPNQQGYYYFLTLTVTDELHELEYMMAWEISVKNNIGEGLVVATTSDNANSDLSLIMAPEVTDGYSKTKIMTGVYSANNSGTTIPGIIKQMDATSIYYVNSLLAITDNSVVKVTTSDYCLAGTNDDLFVVSKDSYTPQALCDAYQGYLFIDNHQLTSTWFSNGTKWGLPYDNSYVIPDHIGFNTKSANNVVNFYDESLQGFVYIQGLYFGTTTMQEHAASTSGTFNPASVSNMENLAAATRTDHGFLHLLRNKTTGDIMLYTFAGVESGEAPAPEAVYDFSSAPDIDNAKFFVFLDNQDVMFYATDTKIYAALYPTTTPVFEERYTVPSGEEITTLEVYHQCVTTPTLSTDDKMLVMSTYSDQGKVYLLPYVNIGAANIDTDNIKTFEGFDYITAITPQQ